MQDFKTLIDKASKVCDSDVALAKRMGIYQPDIVYIVLSSYLAWVALQIHEYLLSRMRLDATGWCAVCLRAMHGCCPSGRSRGT